MKNILVIASIIIVFLIAIALFKDRVIKSVVTVTAKQVTGATVKIDKFSLGIFKHSVRIQGFKMYNPNGFPYGILIDLPKIYVDYDLFSIFKGKLHLIKVEVELKEIGLVKNKDGNLNVDSLRVAKKEAAAKRTTKQMPIQIDILKLNMGRIVYKDFSQGKEPFIQVYDLNINKAYKNITSAQQLAILILSEPMKSAGIKGATIYGVAALAGVAVIPLAVGVTLIGKDSAQNTYSVDFERAYNISLDILKSIGRLKKEDRSKGIITAKVDSVDITVKIKKLTDKSTQIVVSARKYLLPKPTIAGGVLYRINDRLK